MSEVTSIKRGRAINGDLVVLRHESLPLDAAFTTFVDVSYRGATHQVFAASDNSGFDYSNATGEFTVGDLRCHVIETLDTVQTQVSHRYQAIVQSPTGALRTSTYESVESLLSLVGALRPQPTPLGITLDPDPDVEYTTAPRVAIQLETGVIEITPLTAEVIDRLPTWQGSPVDAGHLYRGQFTDDTPYLTLVTATCRVVALAGPDVDGDRLTSALSGLHADWKT